MATWPMFLSEDMSANRFRRRVSRRVRERLRAIHQQRAAMGKVAFLGAEAVRRQDPNAGAGRTEPNEKSAALIACENKDTKEALLQQLKAFWADCQEAMKMWKQGERAVSFPNGTYQMRRVHRVHCLGDPPNSS